jgi:uncharacterized protein
MSTTSVRTTATPVIPTGGQLHPLGLTEVRITEGFWAQRQAVNAKATLVHIEHWLERAGWLPNFDLAASGALPEGRHGREFSDSEVYKYLEALAWEICRTGDADLERRFRSIVGRVIAAQEPDGYLNTNFGRPGQAPRWADLEWGHELYCVGHLLQAAVARGRTRPDAGDGLVEAAVRAADLVCSVFGEQGKPSICGHPEIEPALVELARLTGDAKYLAQARLFVDRRGQRTLEDIEFGRDYFQDNVPIRTATVLTGHAVRANYLAAGAVDVAVESDDDGLLEALAAQWANTVARRTYLTGGQGAHHLDEAFGSDWALPPDRSYSETCAGVASIMFSWRLLLRTGQVRYADLIERTLFNVVATSPSADGTAFFYAHTLHQRVPGEPPADDVMSPRASSSLRSAWFDVACCPPNLARTMASLGAYVATRDDEGLQIHQYASGEIRTTLTDGRRIAVDIDTAYPRDGRVTVLFREGSGGPASVTLRVPGWAAGARVTVIPADGAAGGDEPADPGHVTVRRTWQSGDRVELLLPVQPRLTAPDPRIDAVRGCLAVERGPEVLCLESVDLATACRGEDDLSAVELVAEVPPADVDGRTVVTLRVVQPVDAAWPYADPGAAVLAESSRSSECTVPLTPYHDWANRGPGTMRVWLPIAGAEHAAPRGR